MNEPVVAGLEPWLPWPLHRFPWWTEPIRAERLAALRIGTGLVLLLDILITWLPYVSMLYGQDSLGAPEVFGTADPYPIWPWSPLANLASPAVWQGIFLLWALSALLLLLGVFARMSAAVALFIGACLINPNFWLLNSGDYVRNILLFYLMLSPCAAVWAVRPWAVKPAGPVYIHPWPVRLIFLHMMSIYFLSGLTKLELGEWAEGKTLYHVLAALDWTHLAYASLPWPFWLLRLTTWFTLFWEIGFPVLVLWPRTRLATLWIGVLFHLGIGLTLRVGPFGFYMICLYLPLVPWERWFDRSQTSPALAEPPAPDAV